MNVKSGYYTYEIDLIHMTQRNTVSGVVRTIRRVTTIEKPKHTVLSEIVALLENLTPHETAQLSALLAVKADTRQWPASSE